MANSYNEGACHEDRDYTYELAQLDSVMSLSSVLKIQVRGLVSSGRQHAEANADTLTHPHVGADVPIHRHVRTWSLV